MLIQVRILLLSGLPLAVFLVSILPVRPLLVLARDLGFVETVLHQSPRSRSNRGRRPRIWASTPSCAHSIANSDALTATTPSSVLRMLLPTGSAVFSRVGATAAMGVGVHDSAEDPEPRNPNASRRHPRDTLEPCV